MDILADAILFYDGKRSFKETLFWAQVLFKE